MLRVMTYVYGIDKFFQQIIQHKNFQGWSNILAEMKKMFENFRAFPKENNKSKLIGYFDLRRSFRKSLCEKILHSDILDRNFSYD